MWQFSTGHGKLSRSPTDTDTDRDTDTDTQVQIRLQWHFLGAKKFNTTMEYPTLINQKLLFHYINRIFMVTYVRINSEQFLSTFFLNWQFQIFACSCINLNK